MNSNEWKQVKALLDELLSLDGNARRARLAATDVSDEIRAEALSLLSVEDKASDMMSGSAIEFSASFLTDDDIQKAYVGKKIGIYKIVREIDDGGMGAVYLATRDDGKFEQRVAIKLLRRELNTSGLRQRFEQERRILASLEHKNIARLLDAGTTDDGVPYFVMEYVEGLAIDHYCDQNELDLNERLDLFRKVCEAVNFAHRNLIIHRDIKPSNILVTGDGVPKLLDFGISKIISDEFDQTATVTRLGAMTPSYASPEQLQNKSVTTATDIYSLGVVLYKLLSGHRPFEARENDLNAIYQAVVETDPPAPSSMIGESSQSGEPRSAVERESATADTASNRASRTFANRIAVQPQQLKGDLDNIILKALKKEPERRYSSAENFAEDIHRYQRGLTVSARPDVFSYRAAKFIRRNRFAVGAAALLLVAVLTGVVATLWQYRVAAAERDRARQQARKAEKISEYLQNILNFNNPHWLSSNPERNRNATVAQAMESALQSIGAELADEPDVQGELLLSIATSYNQQGKYDRAEEISKQAIESYDRAYGEGNLHSMRVFVILGDILTNRAKYEESIAYSDKAVDYFRPIVEQDKSEAKWLLLGLNHLGNAYVYTGRNLESEATHRESIDLVKFLDEKDKVVAPIVLGAWGNSLANVGNFEEALKAFDRAYAEMKAAGTDRRIEGAQLLIVRGRTYTVLGDFESAERDLQTSLAIQSENAVNNFYTTLVLYALANNYLRWGKYPESRTMILRALEAIRQLFPDGHAGIGVYSRVLGDLYSKAGELKKGEAELRMALTTVNKYFKEPNQDIALVKSSLGENLIAQKRFAEARTFLTEALDSYIKTRGENHPFTKRCRQLLDSIPN